MKREPPLAFDLPIDALVLAGRREGEADPLANMENASHKALLLAGGKPLIRRVVEALRSAKAQSIQIAAAAAS